VNAHVGCMDLCFKLYPIQKEVRVLDPTELVRCDGQGGSLFVASSHGNQ
jgi:hypothetical protein